MPEQSKSCSSGRTRHHPSLARLHPGPSPTRLAQGDEQASLGAWPWDPLRATADPRNESIGQAVRAARLVSGDCITESGTHTISQTGTIRMGCLDGAYCWKTFPAPAICSADASIVAMMWNVGQAHATKLFQWLEMLPNGTRTKFHGSLVVYI